MTDLPAPSKKSSESEMLMSLLEHGVQTYNRDIEVRALEADNQRYELETERMQAEGELKVESEKLAFNRHAIDRYYENDWRKFQIKAGITCLAVLFFMVIVTVLLFNATDFNQRFDLIKSVATVLLAMLGGKSLADLFKREKPPTEEK